MIVRFFIYYVYGLVYGISINSNEVELWTYDSYMLTHYYSPQPILLASD